MSDYIEELLGAHQKLIMDPVHGGIGLYPHEVAVIDHSLFQRLRSICQNDILSLVFPGATHSRFLHSIGAMHVSDRMFRSMFDAYLIESGYSQDKRMNPPLESLAYLLKVVRLGCLLHDCGHSSFSHQFTRSSKINTLLAEPGRFENLWQGEDYRPYFSEPPTVLEHEHYSVRCAHEIFKDIDLSQYGVHGEDVIGVMETTDCDGSEHFQHHAIRFVDFVLGETRQQDTSIPDSVKAKSMQRLLASLVSGEIDADRADYMLRDGFHSSVSLGGFNLDHLLSNLRIGWHLNPFWLGLAISHKGLGALEDFVYSRHQMYRQVYAHKTALGFDWMLREAINEVLSDESILQWIDQCLSDISEYRKLTDHYFWEAFRKYGDKHPESFSRCVVDRIKLRHIDTQENLSPEEERDLSSQYAIRLGVPEDRVVTCAMNARFSNIRKNFNLIRILTRDPLSRKRQLKSITEVSKFFEKFADGRITHFYLTPF